MNVHSHPETRFRIGEAVWHSMLGFGTVHEFGEYRIDVSFLGKVKSVRNLPGDAFLKPAFYSEGGEAFYVGQEVAAKGGGVRGYGTVRAFDRFNDAAEVFWANGETTTALLGALEAPLLRRDDPAREDPITDRLRPPASPLTFLSYDDMLALPDPEWLIDGVLMEETSALLFGKSNAFKSFLAVDMACAVATEHVRGTGWHGHSIPDGWPVLYIATEGGIGVAKQRIPGWMEHHKVHEPARRNITLYPQEIALDDDRAVDDLLKSCAINCAVRENTDDWNDPSFAFKLVVIDIFGSTMMGPETSDETARAWVRNINRIQREMRCTILTVAHTGWADDTRARMHTHFWGSFDTRMKATGDKEARTTVLKIDRHKDADSTGEWGFQLVEAFAPNGASTLVPTLSDDVDTTPRKRVSGKPLVALQALDEALAESGRKINATGLPSCPVVEAEKWRAMCDRHGLTDSDNPETRRKTFQRARDELMKKDMIRCFDAFVWRAQK